MINLGKLSEKGKDVILEEQPNGCMKCISHCDDQDGYIRIRYKGKHERLFRVLYTLKYGEIPKGKVIRHLCNNSWCVNVNHLKIGTQKDNVRDMIISGHSNKGKPNIKVQGSKNVMSKLSEQQVKEIYLSNLPNIQLSKIYGVSDVNIGYIKNKKQWKWLTDILD